MNPALSGFPTWMGGNVPIPNQFPQAVTNVAGGLPKPPMTLPGTAYAGEAGLGAARGLISRSAGPLAIPATLASIHKAVVPMDQPDANISRTDSWDIPKGKGVDTRGISFTDPRSGNLSIPVKDVQNTPSSAPTLAATGTPIGYQGINPYDYAGVTQARNRWIAEEDGRLPSFNEQKESKGGGGLGGSTPIPKFNRDPRAESFVREFNTTADKHLAGAQDLANQRLQAEIRNIGRSPIAALASYGGTMNAANDVEGAMGMRALNAQKTGALGTPAIKQGNVGVEATQDAELKHWLDENSSLHKAQAAHAQAQAKGNPLNELLASEGARAFGALPEKERNKRALAAIPSHMSPEDQSDLAVIKQMEQLKLKLIEDPAFRSLKPEEQKAQFNQMLKLYTGR